jgi:ubiquinone/menaquinone biosynthesis C-methylase UbiE
MESVKLRRWYDTAHSSSSFKARLRFYRMVRNCAKGRYLDLSCGEGYVFAFEDGVGTDFSIVALSHARQEFPTSSFVLADSHYIPFADEMFDTVSCLGSLEHYLNPKQVFGEISRVLTANGFLLISVPNGHGWTRVLSTLLPFRRQPLERHFSVKEFSNLLAEKGFRVTSLINPKQIIPFRKLEWLNRVFRLVDDRVSPLFAVEPLYVCSRINP